MNCRNVVAAEADLEMSCISVTWAPVWMIVVWDVMYVKLVTTACYNLWQRLRIRLTAVVLCRSPEWLNVSAAARQELGIVSEEDGEFWYLSVHVCHFCRNDVWYLLGLAVGETAETMNLTSVALDQGRNKPLSAPSLQVWVLVSCCRECLHACLWLGSRRRHTVRFFLPIRPGLDSIEQCFTSPPTQ